MAKQKAAESTKEQAEGKKTKCPITRQQFLENGKPILLTFGSGDGAEKKVMGMKEFSTGSFGWFLNEKVTVEIDGVPVKVQINVNATIVGSKELTEE